MTHTEVINGKTISVEYSIQDRDFSAFVDGEYIESKGTLAAAKTAAYTYIKAQIKLDARAVTPTTPAPVCMQCGDPAEHSEDTSIPGIDRPGSRIHHECDTCAVARFDGGTPGPAAKAVDCYGNLPADNISDTDLYFRFQTIALETTTTAPAAPVATEPTDQPHSPASPAIESKRVELAHAVQMEKTNRDMADSLRGPKNYEARRAFYVLANEWLGPCMDLRLELEAMIEAAAAAADLECAVIQAAADPDVLTALDSLCAKCGDAAEMVDGVVYPLCEQCAARRLAAEWQAGIVKGTRPDFDRAQLDAEFAAEERRAGVDCY